MSNLVGILAGESDRGLALAGAAMLDDALEVLLKARLLDKPKAVTSIVGFARPLGTCSSRIKVTYLLGLLEETEFRDLELIRKIRNDCAHNRGDVDFGAAPHKDRIAELHTQNTCGSNIKGCRIYSHQVVRTVKLDTSVLAHNNVVHHCHLSIESILRLSVYFLNSTKFSC